MKHDLCEAFCAELSVEPVPAGFAIATGFTSVTGEQLVIYAIGPSENGLWHLQDDGMTIPYIEASGADLQLDSRRDVFNNLLTQYHANYDQTTGEIATDKMAFEDISKAFLAFSSLLVRTPELFQTTRERAANIWIEEAIRDLKKTLADRAEVEEHGIVSPALADWPADLIVRTKDREPVAVFFGTADPKAYQALLLHSTARYQFKVPCRVVLLIESDKALTSSVRRNADNSLVVPRYKGAERQAVARIAEEALGIQGTVH